MDLSGEQWDAVTEAAQLTGPDGVQYTRRTTKTKRSTCDDLVRSGAPLVLYCWAGGQFDWFDGDDALAQWASVRKRVTSQEPRRDGKIEWTAGIWNGEAGQQAIILTGHC